MKRFRKRDQSGRRIPQMFSCVGNYWNRETFRQQLFIDFAGCFFPFQIVGIISEKYFKICFKNISRQTGPDPSRTFTGTIISLMRARERGVILGSSTEWVRVFCWSLYHLKSDLSDVHCQPGQERAEGECGPAREAPAAPGPEGGGQAWPGVHSAQALLLPQEHQAGPA